MSAARQDAQAYDRYLAAMDAAMRQKIAVTAAHLLARGRVADMGMGSGTGSHALAALYPAMQVVGVDLDPKMVERARARFDLQNLSFVVGDIAERVFDEGSLDGIFDSSVLHHVTSFGGYAHDAAVRAIGAQAAQLRVGGTLIVRDFVAPEDHARSVLLDLPADDGDDSDDPASCSTAALFERFAREFRSLHAVPGFAHTRLDDPKPGWRRYRLRLRHAVEMILRKDYRRDWVNEVREEYTFLTQRELESAFRSLGLRVLASTPIRNPWIVKNRFVGRFVLRDETEQTLPYPATNIVITGEKVAPGDGVGFERTPCAPLGYLEMQAWRDVRSGQTFDLVRRRGETRDLVPYFLDDDGDPFVIARTSYPRPILAVGGDALDGSRAPNYVTEPIVVTEPGDVVDELATQTSIDPKDVRRVHESQTTYPSPGGILEVVRSIPIEIGPDFEPRGHGARSGFASKGRLRAIEGRQLLRAAMVGALPDARLELHTQRIFRLNELDPGPWIGATLDVGKATLPITPVADVLARPVRQRFSPTTSGAGFLAIGAARFDEVDAHGRELCEQRLEWVTPTSHGLATLSCALLARVDGRIVLGVDDDDRPASQAIDGNSQVLVTPAFRLPRHVDSLFDAEPWLLQRLREQYGVDASILAPLGGCYYPTPGLTPEVVHPLAVTVHRAAEHASLVWVPLDELAAQSHALHDGHLALVVHRCAHALSV